MSLLTVCIPTYEMGGLGEQYLRESFDILIKQTFKDFDVVISDHSIDETIKNLCNEYSEKLVIHYYPFTEKRGSSSANLNNAIKKATGKIIKILFQDDFLYSSDALETIAKNFDLKKDTWLITGCEHSNDGRTFYKPFIPKYNRKIHLGNNTISSPSVLTIKNTNPLLFDESLIWLMDCDYYKRCRLAFGKPKILPTITVVNRTGKHQISNTQISEQKKLDEVTYVKNKFRGNFKEILKLETVTLVAVSSVKIPETLRALHDSMRNIQYAQVLFISDTKPSNLDPNITFVQCPKIESIDAYSKFILYELSHHITTAFALIVQYDGYVLRPESWRRDFIEYDYIGAPWPEGTHFTKDGKNIRVGNGGFSLRSKKLLDSFNNLQLPFSDHGTGFYNEDGAICNYYRNELEQSNIVFAPVSIASAFSCETICPDSSPKPFGFHKNKKLIPLTIKIKHWLHI